MPDLTNCECGGILDIVYDYDYIRTRLTKEKLAARQDHTMWRYRELLPVEEDTPNTPLRVGWSPLYEEPCLAEQLGLKRLWVKDDGQNPTASLKDVYKRQMKGSVTAMISAVAHFAEDSGRDFAGEICVSCTVHEECFEGVSSREITRLAKPDFVIIGEATSTTVKIGQRGRAEVVVETEGVSCHSSNPDKGVNAVYHMMAVIEEIRRIIPNEHPILGKGILELTDIISSPYPGASVVPALCRATFDRRTLTGDVYKRQEKYGAERSTDSWKAPSTMASPVSLTKSPSLSRPNADVT